jgi:hypothetical protein
LRQFSRRRRHRRQNKGVESGWVIFAVTTVAVVYAILAATVANTAIDDGNAAAAGSCRGGQQLW